MNIYNASDLHILMVVWSFPPDFGGAGIQAAYLAKQLKDSGIDVEFIANNKEKGSQHDNYNGLTIYRYSTFARNHKISEALFIIRILIHILRVNKYHIIHFHSMEGLEALIFPILRMLKKKIIFKMTLAGSDDPASYKRRRYLSSIYSLGLKYVNCFIAISSKQIELVEKGGISKNRCVYVPNGVDIDKYREVNKNQKIILKKQLGLIEFNKIFLSVGKIEDRKNYIFLLDVWKILLTKYPASALILVGPGNTDENEYYRKLNQRIQGNALSGVIFTGQVDNVDLYMKVADTFLFASKMEGFGTVLIEALTTSLPVVVKNIEKVTEDIIGEESKEIARICYSNSPEEFASLVIDLNENKDVNARKEIIQLYREKFAMRNISSQYTSLYLNLLAES